MDDSLPGSSVHGIFQARVLEWGDISFSVLNLTQPLTSESPSLVSVWSTTRLTSQEADEIGGSKILPSGKGFWCHSVLSRSCTGVGTMTLWSYGGDMVTSLDALTTLGGEKGKQINIQG